MEYNWSLVGGMVGLPGHVLIFDIRFFHSVLWNVVDRDCDWSRCGTRTRRTSWQPIFTWRTLQHCLRGAQRSMYSTPELPQSVTFESQNETNKQIYQKQSLIVTLRDYRKCSILYQLLICITSFIKTAKALAYVFSFF